MRSAMDLGLGALFSLLVACSSDSANPAQPGPATDAAADQTTSDTSLPKCPDEVDFKTVTLPCDCYGHEANATTIVDPTCKTQTVCCPTIQGIRCEDHEYCDDAGNCWDAATVPEAAADATPKCPDEVDLSKTTLPCDCYGTLVSDPKTDLPSCTLTVKCCPGEQGLKCE
jgi:hypothetical protein